MCGVLSCAIVESFVRTRVTFYLTNERANRKQKLAVEIEIFMVAWLALTRWLLNCPVIFILWSLLLMLHESSSHTHRIVLCVVLWEEAASEKKSQRDEIERESWSETLGTINSIKRLWRSNSTRRLHFFLSSLSHSLVRCFWDAEHIITTHNIQFSDPIGWFSLLLVLFSKQLLWFYCYSILRKNERSTVHRISVESELLRFTGMEWEKNENHLKVVEIVHRKINNTKSLLFVLLRHGSCPPWSLIPYFPSQCYKN